MSVVDRVGLAAAEQLERSVGPYIALASYRRLMTALEDRRSRGLAAVGAVRCAIELGELDTVVQIAHGFGEPGSPSLLPEVIPLCARLVRLGRADAAAEVARADTERTPLARGFYLLARCCELAGDRRGASAARVRAAERAEAEGASDVLIAARVSLLDDADEPALSSRAAAALDPGEASPAQRLVIARSRLAAPSRFTRASGLSLLDDLAKAEDGALAETAVRLAAEHADALAEAITPLEVERVAAVLARWPEASERESALARLGALARIAAATGEVRERALDEARDVAPELEGQHLRARAVIELPAPPPAGDADSAGAGRAGSSPQLRLASLAIDAVTALKQGRDGSGALAEAATILEAPGNTAAPAALWTAAGAALGSADPRVRAAGGRVAARLLSTARCPPPRGFVGFAAVLRRAGAAALELVALRRATALREPRAASELSAARLREGWALARSGDRDGAIAALRDARDVLVSGAI